MDPMSAAVGAANLLVGKAMSKLSDNVLEAWAASSGLGNNVKSIKTELLFAHAILHKAQRHRIDNPSLGGLLQQLEQLACDAEDLLDELDYFRIQDELEGSHKSEEQVDGCICGLALHARYAAANAVGKVTFGCFSCSSSPKLKFDRVGVSTRMKSMAEQMQPICDRVSNILNLEFSSSKHSDQAQAQSKPLESTSLITDTEDIFLGRDDKKNEIITELTSDKHKDKDLLVIPIVGGGGIGKTTFVKHVCKEVKKYFNQITWICVTQNFNVLKLTDDIANALPKAEDEKTGNKNESKTLDNLQSIIKNRLKQKKFLLVFDDLWGCGQEEWDLLLAPFKNKEVKGNMILVTTRNMPVVTMVKSTDYLVELKGLPDDVLKDFLLKCTLGNDYESKADKKLMDIVEKFVTKLKGVPLAAKTVSRLLKKDCSTNQWNRIFESDEWKSQEGNHDIMPVLRLTYDYLPFHLQKCFSYCALFPDDHEFSKSELVQFWIGLGIVQSYGQQSKKYEEIAAGYLKDLVDHGLFEEQKGDYYVMHDLIRDLAQQVSSHECLTIDPSVPRSGEIPPCIHHLSIITRYHVRKVEKNYGEYLKKELDKLRELRMEDLKTLMLIGEYDLEIAKLFKEVFKDAVGLRVLTLSTMTYDPNFLLCNFSKLLHLHYLKLESASWRNPLSVCQLTRCISKFYHLRVLDLTSWYEYGNLPKDITNLINLRHFLVRDEYIHSEIACVGKLRYLQELRSFQVKTHNSFQPCQLGGLTELGGSLTNSSLNEVKAKEEAMAAKLMYKSNLQKLALSWEQSHSETTKPEEILESLKPHSNLQELYIEGYGGKTCPTWLNSNDTFNQIKSLHLMNCTALEVFPPLGQLSSLRELELESIPCLIEWETQLFENAKREDLPKLIKIILKNMENLEKWVGGDTYSCFSHLEVLKISDCPKLNELASAHCSSSGPEESTNWFPSLKELEIDNCPELMSLPPMPHTPTLSEVYIRKVKLVDRLR